MDIPTSIRLPNFNLDTRHNTVLIQEVWSGDDGNEWEDALTDGSNLEVFPGQPRASCQDWGGGEEGDEEVRWLYDRQGVSGWRRGGQAARKWVRKREREREGVRSWLQCRVFKWSVRPTPITTSTPEHPRYPCLMPKGLTPSVPGDTGVFTRTHARTRARTDLSHVESRNGNMQLGRQASLRRLENSKDLPRDPADRCRTSKDLEPRPSVITTPFVEKRHAIASLDMLLSRKQRIRYLSRRSFSSPWV